MKCDTTFVCEKNYPQDHFLQLIVIKLITYFMDDIVNVAGF
jgi:hypothetical protein